MLKRWEYLTVTLAALVIVLLVAANMVLFSISGTAQAEVVSRAQYIQESAQLAPLYREMVGTLSDLAVRTNDVALRAVLVKQGLMPAAPPAAAPAPEILKGGKQ